MKKLLLATIFAMSGIWLNSYAIPAIVIKPYYTSLNILSDNLPEIIIKPSCGLSDDQKNCLENYICPKNAPIKKYLSDFQHIKDMGYDGYLILCFKENK